jgi:transcriptional regulator with XRE-family HTH domain
MRLIHTMQLRACRALLGWSMKDLSDHSGVSVAMIKRAEMSLGEPDIQENKLAALCGALHSAGVVFTVDLSRVGVALDLRRR